MYEIMKAINNFFITTTEQGSYAIVSDGITGTFNNTYLVGMYIVIKDSYLNDGVYKITAVTSSKLTLDATLSAEDTGENIIIGSCKIPADFVSLSTEIATWISNNTDGVASESIDDYSISYNTAEGTGWKGAFATRLNTYRKMYNYFDSAPARNRYRYGRCW